MPTSILTALALSVQIAAPTLPNVVPVPLALHDVMRLAEGVELVPEAGTSLQTAPQRSKRGRIIKGALIGGTIFAALSMTVGQEMCLNQPRWVCGVKGGAMGAVLGALIAWK